LAKVAKEARLREYENAFYWLDDANIANICFNSVDPNVGLKINSERTTLKCYLCDTGLLVTHSLDERASLDSEVYRAIILGKLSINEGAFAENAVAQAFAANGKKLYFYSRLDRDNSSNTMEIDFLISEGKKIAPVEVKSGDYKGHRSLDKFKSKFGARIGTRYVLHTKDLKVEDDIVCLPIYMAMFL
jgi:predicted AAA+ superfamily ATPase